MKIRCALAILVLSVPLALAGCGEQAPPGNGKKADAEAKIRAALEKLPPEDRPLAEAQKFCAVEGENRLGSMGTPVKVVVKDQPVFLCCKGCKEKALQDPEKTLARIKELKENNTPPSTKRGPSRER